jgi:hypothetical protein
MVGGLAFVVRAMYGLFIHPPFSFVRSDAGGYILRAQSLLDGNFSADPNSTFFPYGTHFLLAAVLGVSGRAEWSVGIAWALLGTFAVVFSMLAAQAFLPDRPRAVLVTGLILALYPPWIEHGGFALSETPAAFCISGAALFGVRLSREGRSRDAFLLGLVLALGIAFRPQILTSVAALALVFVLRRRELGAPRWPAAALAAVPIAAVLIFSAARMKYHTGHLGLVSTNGAFNYALGRCHAHTLAATESPRSAFQPPGFLRLWRFREKSGVDPIPALDPALTPELTFKGKVWQEEPARELADRCVEATGPVRQVKYGLTHLLLLWAYNVPWPTTGAVAAISSVAHAVLLLPGLVVALFRSLKKAGALALTLTAHLFAMFAVAIVFFGEARLRMPYDGIIVLCAVWVYADWLTRWKKSPWRAAPAAP